MSEMVKLGPEDLAKMPEKGEEVLRVNAGDYNVMMVFGQIVFQGDVPIEASTGRRVVVDNSAPDQPKRSMMGLGVQAKLSVKLTVEKPEMKFTQPMPGLCHLIFPHQDQLTRAFVRLQEFYESPYDDIRGRHFTIEQFASRYAADRGGHFTYYTDWHGFNVPGHVASNFFAEFSDLTPAERSLLVAVRNTERTPDGRFYIIGTCVGGEDDATEHEMAHAMFYLFDEYRVRMTECVRSFQQSSPNTYRAISEWLLKKGYAERVLVDELQAWLATTDNEYWIKVLGLLNGTDAYMLGARFRELFKAFRPAP